MISDLAFGKVARRLTLDHWQTGESLGRGSGCHTTPSFKLKPRDFITYFQNSETRK